LSAKFAVQLDGGEALAMLEHPHDLWLSAFERDGERLWRSAWPDARRIARSARWRRSMAMHWWSLCWSCSCIGPPRADAHAPFAR
jgi:hypothetical protein